MSRPKHGEPVKDFVAEDLLRNSDRFIDNIGQNSTKKVLDKLVPSLRKSLSVATKHARIKDKQSEGGKTGAARRKKSASQT
jgi:hypothetical protein